MNQLLAMKKLSFFVSISFSVLFLQSCTQRTNETSGGKDAIETYYTKDDYASVEKFDSHFHFSTKDTSFLSFAKSENFNLLAVNVDAFPSLPVNEQQEIALYQKEASKGQVQYATAFSVANWDGEEWEQETLDYLKDSFSKGAITVKVWKNIGMDLRDKEGNLVMIDHPRFDPIWNYLVKNNIPVIGHLGEPKNCWLPIEEMTVKGDRNYFSKHPEFHMYLHPEMPSYEDQLEARDNVLRKHPELKFVGAHLGSLEWSVDELAKRLDMFPNLAVDMAERISHLQLQSIKDHEKVRNFVIKYQDRLLYGTDMSVSGSRSSSDMEKHAHDIWFRHWVFFTSGDKMSAPKVQGEFQGLKLPREVVDKIYSLNAKKWLPRLNPM